MQANWGDVEGSFFNIAWIIKVLDELNTTVSNINFMDSVSKVIFGAGCKDFLDQFQI